MKEYEKIVRVTELAQKYGISIVFHCAKHGHKIMNVGIMMSILMLNMCANILSAYKKIN